MEHRAGGDSTGVDGRLERRSRQSCCPCEHILSFPGRQPSQGSLDELSDDPVADLALELVPTSGQHAQSALLREEHGDLEEPRLADACRALDHDCRALTRAHGY